MHLRYSTQVHARVHTRTHPQLPDPLVLPGFRHRIHPVRVFTDYSVLLPIPVSILTA